MSLSIIYGTSVLQQLPKTTAEERKKLGSYNKRLYQDNQDDEIDLCFLVINAIVDKWGPKAYLK